MNKIIVFFCCAAMLLGACDSRKAVLDAQAETERAHDEAMKLMGPLNAAARQLKQEMQNIDTLSARYDSIRQTIATIQRVESDMMTWMVAYQPPKDDVPKETALQYFQDKQKAIEQNGAESKAALEQAQNLLKNIPGKTQ